MRAKTEYAQLEKRHSERVQILYRQFEFLKTRQDAAEAMLQESTWVNRLQWLLFPADYLTALNTVHRRHLDISATQAATHKAVQSAMGSAAQPPSKILRVNG